MDATNLKRGSDLDAAVRRIVLSRPIPMELAQAIADAPIVLSPAKAREPGGLTPARLKVLRLLVLGLTNREIAEALERSEETVKRQVRELLRTVGAKNRAHLAALAVAYGIADVRPLAEPSPVT